MTSNLICNTYSLRICFNEVQYKANIFLKYHNPYGIISFRSCQVTFLVTYTYSIVVQNYSYCYVCSREVIIHTKTVLDFEL